METQINSFRKSVSHKNFLFARLVTWPLYRVNASLFMYEKVVCLSFEFNRLIES
jgi:hypothetical protein